MLRPAPSVHTVITQSSRPSSQLISTPYLLVARRLATACLDIPRPTWATSRRCSETYRKEAKEAKEARKSQRTYTEDAVTAEEVRAQELTLSTKSTKRTTTALRTRSHSLAPSRPTRTLWSSSQEARCMIENPHSEAAIRARPTTRAIRTPSISKTHGLVHMGHRGK